ncbi:MAG: heavy metal translocating P-type ATPase metal-binding domain-containing protein [Chitinophagaceae bacterium]
MLFAEAGHSMRMQCLVVLHSYTTNMSAKVSAPPTVKCYHCGDECAPGNITIAAKDFCCEGCKLVYEILNNEGLCTYYDLNTNPGLSQKIKLRKDKFAFLDDESIQARLISFKNEEQVHGRFYIPQIHCSSCLYLLENLHKLNHGIVSAKVNFSAKEVAVVYTNKETSLRKVAELLASIGYEPYISLHDLKGEKPSVDRSMIYRLGVAGFCFGNIMLMSFPEYLGIDASETMLRNLFRWLNFLLALPVFFYAAYPFYDSSYKSLRHRFLNIDAPIALAVIITFIRSVWEVFSGTGAGYFDSMSGIVFFMLAGRILQDKTYRQLSFTRDYTSYFPVAVTVLKDNMQIPTALPQVKPGDTLLLHNEELIPADGILTKGKAFIDYSFVTGESIPLPKETGELVYAGGRQKGSTIELLVVKEVTQSYLTSLWEKDDQQKTAGNTTSFVHLLSRYFTYIVFALAIITAVYWQWNNPAKLWPAVTSIFIIACPCALLLSNSFTNGNILNILSRQQFFLRNAQTIENIAGITHIVFDKTGTLTNASRQQINYSGKTLTALQKQQVAALVACSSHPLSKALAKLFVNTDHLKVKYFKEIPGEGMEAYVGDALVRMGNSGFVSNNEDDKGGTVVYLSFNNNMLGWFRFSNYYRHAVPAVIKELKKKYRIAVLTGDNDAEKNHLQHLLGSNEALLFNQKPEDKLAYIRQLQQHGARVMMIGDGLNDAGALQQSDVGIALTEDSNNFTPASDAIMSAEAFPQLAACLALCRANRRIVIASFIMSIAYNLIGLYFAMQGNLSPLVAAILMPSSSLSIILLTFGCSSLLGRNISKQKQLRADKDQLLQ